jgi:sorbitol/mannitol transport system permease protein
MFSTLFSLLDRGLTVFGWLGPVHLRPPLGTIVTVTGRQWTPFMMLIILAGLKYLATSLEARTSRGDRFRIFRRLTFPTFAYLELGAVLGSIYIVQAFDPIDVMTGGGPGSTNVPYYVYEQSIGGGFRYGAASAYAIVIVIFAIIIATLALRLLSSLFADEERA